MRRCLLWKIDALSLVIAYSLLSATHGFVEPLNFFWPDNCGLSVTSHSSPIFSASLSGKTNSLQLSYSLEAAPVGCLSLLLNASLRLPQQKSQSWCLLTRHMVIKQCSSRGVPLPVWKHLVLHLGRCAFPFYHLPATKLETPSYSPAGKQ